MMRGSIALLAVLWLAAPVLACLPNATMTDAEMACCQKMGGDCDMGTGNHACCKDTMHRAPSVATMAQNSQTDVSVVAIATISTGDVYDEIFVEQNGAGFRLSVCPQGSSPLALDSILRI
jgi:hypothetical protein